MRRQDEEMTNAERFFYLAVVLPLAVGAAIDAWRNGSIFAGRRAIAEAYSQADPSCVGRGRVLAAAQLECPFCLS
jgi:hypothetical protein